MSTGCFAMHRGDADLGTCAAAVGGTGDRAKRHMPRHARFGRSECGLFGAGLTGQCKGKVGLRRHAEFAANRVAKFYVE